MSQHVVRTYNRARVVLGDSLLAVDFRRGCGVCTYCRCVKRPVYLSVFFRCDEQPNCIEVSFSR